MLPKLVAEYDSESRTPIRRAARSAAHPGLRSLGPGPGPRVEPAPLSADPGPAGAAGNSCGLAPARGWLPPARSCPARDRWASGCQCRSTGRGLMRDASRCAVSRRSESAGPGAGFSHAVAPWGSQAWGCFELLDSLQDAASASHGLDCHGRLARVGPVMFLRLGGHGRLPLDLLVGGVTVAVLCGLRPAAAGP